MERLIKSVAASLVVSASFLAPIKTFASPKTVVIYQPRHSSPVQASNRSVSVYRTASPRTVVIYQPRHSSPVQASNGSVSVYRTASPRTVVIYQLRHSSPVQASNGSVGGYGSIRTRDDDRLYCANYIVLASSKGTRQKKSSHRGVN